MKPFADLYLKMYPKKFFLSGSNIELNFSGLASPFLKETKCTRHPGILARLP